MKTQSLTLCAVSAMIGSISLTVCKRDQPAGITKQLGPGHQTSGEAVTSAPLVGIRLERSNSGIQLWFSYRDVGPQEPAPRIRSAAIDSLSLRATVCEIRTEGDRGALLESGWSPQRTPVGFRSRGCQSLEPGAYEVHVVADVGQGSQRFEIQKGGELRLLPWEDERAAAEAAKRFDSLVEQDKRQISPSK
jgi:hypothetical protein